jgi:shikimate kinase
LIGFMGAGKSSFGKKIAPVLGMDFIDLDTVIEEKTGQSIGEIFSSCGEEVFREMETRVLREVAIKENKIIATGGGSPCFHNNMRFICIQGLSIFLKPKLETILDYLKKHQEARPLLRDHPCFEDHVRSLYLQRLPYYRQAEWVIDPHFFNIDYLTNYKYTQEQNRGKHTIIRNNYL